ncbi:MAG: hypothetical protein JXB85_06460 [Anaerolineales bacterium]|nr:hypothetical protein [Anaerolineales bacterium]
MRKQKLWISLSALVLILASLACGTPAATPTPIPTPTSPPPPPPPTGASLTIINNSGVDIWYLYVSPSTSSSWGDDQLGADIITAGSTYTLTGITEGNYDLLVEDTSHNTIETWMGVALSGSTTWTVVGAGGNTGGGGTVSLEITNHSGVDIFYLYISPTTSSDWGDDQLGADIISVGSTYTLSNIPAGTYDIKVEDSSHNVIESYAGVVFDTNLTWDVTGSNTGGATGGNAGMSSLTIINNTGVDIWYIYLVAQNTATWGPDQLGSDILSAGGTYTITGIPPAFYDVKFEDSNHNVLIIVEAVDLRSNNTITLSP